jgi:hypothetical protein
LQTPRTPPSCEWTLTTLPLVAAVRVLVVLEGRELKLRRQLTCRRRRHWQRRPSHPVRQFHSEEPSLAIFMNHFRSRVIFR